MDEKPQLRRSNKVDDVREDSELEGLSRTGSRKLRESNEENYKKKPIKSKTKYDNCGVNFGNYYSILDNVFR